MGGGNLISMDIDRWLSVKNKNYNRFIGLVYLI